MMHLWAKRKLSAVPNEAGGCGNEANQVEAVQTNEMGQPSKKCRDCEA